MSGAGDPMDSTGTSPLVQELLARIAERVSAARLPAVREFARAYVRRISPELLPDLVAEELFGQIVGLFELADRRGTEPLAVRAFNPTLASDGYAAKAVYAMVLRHQGAYRLRYPRSGTNGKHVEFDWSRQVLVLAQRGRPYRVYHTSSGAPVTPTVFGSYRFYRQDPGTNSKGMVHSSYFIGGYAIHGYPSVPNFPASHGCLRVPIPNAWSIFNWIDIGDPIYTYR